MRLLRGDMVLVTGAAGGRRPVVGVVKTVGEDGSIEVQTLAGSFLFATPQDCLLLEGGRVKSVLGAQRRMSTLWVAMAATAQDGVRLATAERKRREAEDDVYGTKGAWEVVMAWDHVRDRLDDLTQALSLSPFDGR